MGPAVPARRGRYAFRVDRAGRRRGVPRPLSAPQTPPQSSSRLCAAQPRRPRRPCRRSMPRASAPATCSSPASEHGHPWMLLW